MFRHQESSMRPNPFSSHGHNQPQQPGAGESQNTPPPPFNAQGSQPPRVGQGRRNRVQQNRYAVPTTMQYSESSQAEAGQQIDRLRHMNQPVPSALFNENSDPNSNPSNLPNIPPVSNDSNNEQITMPSENTEEGNQQFTNGQQDSAQPGVPATNNLVSPPEEGAENDYAQNTFSTDVSPLNTNETLEEGKVGHFAGTEESKEHSNIQIPEKDNSQERQGVEDPSRHYYNENKIESSSYNEDRFYSNKVPNQNDSHSPKDKETQGVNNSKKAGHRRQSQGSNYDSNEKTEEKRKTIAQPFGYKMGTPKSGNHKSFVCSSSYTENLPYSSQASVDNSRLTSTYFQLNNSRNSGRLDSNTHTNSVSSFPVTNYEDSEFMIQAYQRKKKAYEKCKQKLLQSESDLHMERQRCKMFQEENKRCKMTIKKLEKKYKSLMQANAKQEKEQLKRSLDMANKEKEMYKKERENLNKDNLRLRKSMQDLVNQNNMLKRQVTIFEQQEDVTNDQKADTIKEQLDYEIDRLRKELSSETEKTKKWEQYANEMKINKEKAETEKNDIMKEIENLRKQVNQLKHQNTEVENERDQLRNK